MEQAIHTNGEDSFLFIKMQSKKYLACLQKNRNEIEDIKQGGI